MSTNLYLQELSSNPDAHLPEASDFRSDDVVRVTLDSHLRPVRGPVAAKKAAPNFRQRANYLPFWDDGLSLTSDWNDKADDTEYSI